MLCLEQSNDSRLNIIHFLKLNLEESMLLLHAWIQIQVDFLPHKSTVTMMSVGVFLG